ncbi:hypothetical protein LLH03_09980 [bacterium]|nr:hypothetical protein [bacterium]
METTAANQAPSMDPRLRQAALILSALGLDDAVSICRRVDPLTAHRLIRVLGMIGTVGSHEKAKAAREVLTRMHGDDAGLDSLAATLKERVLGMRNGFGDLTSEETELSLERLSLLDKADASLIWRAIGGEMPQTIALITRHLSPLNVARLLSIMPDDLRTEVAYRMASPRPATSGALKAFARVTDRLIKVAASGANSSDGTMQFFVDVISQMKRADTQRIIGAIRERSEETAARIEQLIFKFTDLLRLPPVSLQTILRNVSTNDLALALKGIAEDLRQVVLNNLSHRARAVLEEEISLLGAVPASEAERAQREIVQVARSLDAAGEISLEPGEVEYVE